MALLRFLKTALIGGMLVVFPAWLAILIVLKILQKLATVVQPVSVVLPESINHPMLIASVLMIVICLIVGTLIQSMIGLRFKNAAEKAVFERIPGYTTIRGLVSQMSSHEDKKGFEPALVEIEEALAPCFIIERHEGELCTVFIPSAPTPAAGAILIIANNRVHPINLPVTKIFKCVTNWGTGSGELLAAMPKPTSP